MITALPTLVAPSLPDPRVADAAGGFMWWYADLTDEAGNGVVAILSLGLPFLPGYTSAARKGSAPPARERPAIAFAVVKQGRPVFWALHETLPETTVWERERVRLGESEVTVSIDNGALKWRASLRGQLPGCDWRAELNFHGPLRQPCPGEPSAAPHEWTVLAAGCPAQADLWLGDHRMTLRGRGYVDRNASPHPLTDLGLSHWTWGRVAREEGARIWYHATDDAGATHSMALAVAPDGASTVVRGAVNPQGRRRGRWGLDYPASVQVGPDLEVPLGKPIDDSPFYARFAIPGGFAEACRPHRVDAAWFRPLARMTVCHDAVPAANSRWLPLLTGLRGTP